MNTTVTWQPKYEIGVEKIDFEHKIFLTLIHEFEQQIQSFPDPDLLLHRMEEIRKYAEFHFLSEENVMMESHFSEFEIHRGFHQTLLQELNAKIHSVQSKAMKPESLVEFIFEWFVVHTTQEDQRIAKHLSFK